MQKQYTSEATATLMASMLGLLAGRAVDDSAPKTVRSNQRRFDPPPRPSYGKKAVQQCKKWRAAMGFRKSPMHFLQAA